MQYSLFVGCYGEGGITRLSFDETSLRQAASAPMLNASHLCMGADKRHIYAVSETQRFQDSPGGSVHSFAILPDGSLKEDSVRGTYGRFPCHCLASGDLLMVCNFTSGSLSRFPLNSDGTIGRPLPVLQFDAPAGSRRYSRLSQCILTPEGYIAVVDNGLDRLYYYRSSEIDSRQPHAVASAVEEGFGPRQAVCSGDSHHIWYILCDRKSYMLVYQGSPTARQRIGRIAIGSGRVEGVPGVLRLSPDRHLLAVTNRGPDTISLYYLCENGIPALLLETSSRGRWPRDVQFSPDGKYLAVANEKSSNVVLFGVSDGHLDYITQTQVGSPACLLFKGETP
ncbi:MAG: beta-propeller fold lactonase family protein [Clostridia bacterium]|nr:beta-propeller fold lactonase family protein [Clostridia bacterium]